MEGHADGDRATFLSAKDIISVVIRDYVSPGRSVGIRS